LLTILIFEIQHFLSQKFLLFYRIPIWSCYCFSWCSNGVLRIHIEKMQMRIQEKISMRMRIHAFTELLRAE
jgi:hypothetical protein